MVSGFLQNGIFTQKLTSRTNATNMRDGECVHTRRFIVKVSKRSNRSGVVSLRAFVASPPTSRSRWCRQGSGDLSLSLLDTLINVELPCPRRSLLSDSIGVAMVLPQFEGVSSWVQTGFILEMNLQNGMSHKDQETALRRTRYCSATYGSCIGVL